MFRGIIMNVLLIAATLTALSACEVAPGPLGGVRIRPLPPPEPIKVGSTIVDGRTLCLLDVNGDQVPDLCLDPQTGRLYWVRPPSVYDIPGAGHDNVEPWQPNPFAPYMAGVLDGHEFGWIASHIEWHSGWAPAQPFDFAGMTAEQWIASVGLDVEPDVVADTRAIDLVVLDTGSWHAEAWIFWSGAFGFPRIGDFDLQHEAWALESEHEDSPAFFAIHVAGNATDVLRLVASMGGERGTLDYDGSEWVLVIEDGDDAASLYQDGVWMMTVPLD